MTGSLRVLTAPRRRSGARPRRSRLRQRRDAALPRSAALRRDALVAGLVAAASAACRARCRTVCAEFDADYLYRATRRRRAAIKLALMDSHMVVGVGNIYANEALFRAGIRPTRRPSASRGRASRGWSTPSARRLSDAIAKGGSTLRDYVDSRGEPGYFQLDYCVYGREHEPCRVCGDHDPRGAAWADGRPSTARAASARRQARRSAESRRPLFWRELCYSRSQRMGERSTQGRRG